MKTSLFSGMFKDDPIGASFEQAAKIGYDAVEIYTRFHLEETATPAEAAEIKAMAADNGVAISLVYTGIGGAILSGEEQRAKDLATAERFLDLGDALGCNMVKVGAGRRADGVYDEGEARTIADWLAAVCDKAAAHDARILAELHRGQYFETVDMARRMIDLIDRSNFGVIHDAGNLHICGSIYREDSVDVLGDRIFHVHVKDMVKLPDDSKEGNLYPAGRFTRALLNEGNVDYLALLRGLAKIDFQGYLSCEASGGDDPVSVAKHEMAEMKRLFAQI